MLLYQLGPILRRSAPGKNSPKSDLSKISQSHEVDDEIQGDRYEFSCNIFSMCCHVLQTLYFPIPRSPVCCNRNEIKFNTIVPRV